MAEIIASFPDDPDRRSQSCFGLHSLVRTLAERGVDRMAVFEGSGVSLEQLGDPSARMSRRQRLAIYRNAVRLMPGPGLGLTAGTAQRLSDFGIYGYAFANRPTLGDALLFAVRNMPIACPVTQVRYREEEDRVVLSSHGFDALGDLLVFAAEHWRSSMATLVALALEAPFASLRMSFPYPAPSWRDRYEQVFGCPIEFGTETMEWHIAKATLALPMPGANSGSAHALEALCAALGHEGAIGTGLAKRIRAICRANDLYPTAAEMAERLRMSPRSMARRLSAESTSYQLVVDDVRREAAMLLLRDRTVSIEEIGQRLGYSECANFGKAFRRWAGIAPGAYRATVAARSPSRPTADDGIDHREPAAITDRP